MFCRFVGLSWAQFTGCDVRYAGPASYRVEWSFPNTTAIFIKVTLSHFMMVRL